MEALDLDDSKDEEATNIITLLFSLYSIRTFLTLDKTHMPHMCRKITDETICEVFCVKIAHREREAM